MSYTQPTVTDFKDYFSRDFPYGATASTVMDSDITKAITDMTVNTCQDLFLNQGTYTIGALNLSAHFLVMNLRASSQGIAGNYDWLQSGKSVGSVSESFSIPERILENPTLAMLSKTSYGAKYLMMILPQIVGQIFTVEGTSRA